MGPHLIPRNDDSNPPISGFGIPATRYHQKYVTVIAGDVGDVTATSVSTDVPSPTGFSASTTTPDIYNFTGSPGFSFPSNLAAEDHQLWGKFSMGVKAAVIIAGIFGIVAIVIASIWFCCGRPRRRRLKAEEDMQLHGQRMAAEARMANGMSRERLPDFQVPLRTLSGNQRRESAAPAQARGAVGRVASRLSRHVSLRGPGVNDAPPRYEEVVPPAHQRLAGGMVRRGDQNHISPMEEEDGVGVVADGKTPLSEIPFEDVVLSPPGSGSGSSSSSHSSEGGRDFGYRHAMGGGNTTGHTNA